MEEILILFIDKKALKNNVAAIKKNSGKELIYVAKNDCYGLKCENVLPYIDDCVLMYAVKSAAETSKIKQFTQKDVLVLMPPIDDIGEEFDAKNVVFTVDCVESASKLKKVENPRVHVKFNSGMNRFGVDSLSEFEKLSDYLEKVGIKVVGAYTHLYSNVFDDCKRQLEKFEKVADVVPFTHVTYRTALNGTNYAPYSAVRSGICVLGGEDGFSQCIKLTAKVIKLRHITCGDTVGYDAEYVAEKDETIAVIDFGYNNMAIKKIKGQKVLINGAFYPIISVAMDVCFVRVDENVSLFDEVIVSCDRNGLRLTDYAKNVGTCSHELITSIKPH